MKPTKLVVLLIAYAVAAGCDRVEPAPVGRYQVVSVQRLGPAHAVFLLDTATGETWRECAPRAPSWCPMERLAETRLAETPSPDAGEARPPSDPPRPYVPRSFRPVGGE